MKRLFILFIALSMMQFAIGQSFSKAEYFFDTDPGINNGTQITLSGTSDTLIFSASISTASLATGFHFLGLRVQHNDGTWGLFEKRGFYISTTTSDVANIVAAEYFFDADPGVGNATATSVGTSGAVVNFTASIPTSLSSGFHFLSIRTKDANGIWGLFEKRGFYISTNIIDAANIVAAEYFFDTDPGVGNATATSIGTTGAVVNFTASIPTSLSPGFHFLSIRTKDATGIWGLFEKRGFYVSSLAVNAPIIVAAEYFIDSDPGYGNGIPITVPVPGDTIRQTLSPPVAALPLGNYTLVIRYKDAGGVWSLQEGRPFTVCTIDGPLSQMTYQVEGNKVFFTNNSLNADTLTWKFGDNTHDTVNNPVKTYSTAGVKNVQLITGNICGLDTLTEPVEIRGLQRVNPNRAGNAGISTLMFEGFGFTGATNVKLMLGAQVFNPVAKFLVNNNRIRANFNLTGLAPGTYRVIATLGSAFDTLNNALVIENNIPADITLAMPTGRRLVRPNRIGFGATISNNGSHDAVMVPFVAAANVLPGVVTANLNLFSNTFMVSLPMEGIFQHTFQYLSNNAVPAEVMHFNMLDSARKRHLVAYYKVRIPGHSSVRENLKNTNPNSPLYAFQSGAMVMEQLLDSYALQDTIHSDYKPCYSSFLKHEVKKQLNITVNEAIWNTCFTAAFDTLMRTLARISQNPLLEDYGVPMQAGFSALLAKMADCPGSGVPSNLGGIPFKRIIQGVVNNWIYLEDIDSLDNDCIDNSIQVLQGRMSNNFTGNVNGTTGRIAAGNCADCPGAQIFPEMCDQCLPFLQAGKVGKKLKIKGRAWGANSAVAGCQEWCESNSIDPNAKYGPGNNNDRKYINHRDDIGYTITFENISTATAPAAFVEVRDTIDKTVYDINTLQLGQFSWGDSVITAEPHEKNVSYLKDIRPVHPNYLRIDAVTDTASGIVRWRFWTVDTVTLQLTSSPTEGFLPPNVDGISGAGYVTYTIAPKSTVTNGTILINKAIIIFDENAPIITNEWEHRIDTLKPSSAVNSLPSITNTINFNVSWSGTDAHAGIDLYSIYVSINDSAYKVWKSLTTLTSETYTGVFGKTYKFISVALDKAGNFEDPPLNALNNPDAVTTVQIALPLNLLSFTARKTTDGRKVDLAWETTNEVNVSHFELQRSANGSGFTTIGRVQARNSINGASYSWQDMTPLPKINYYRLRIVDIDGSYKFSPVRLIKMESMDDILVFPTVTSNLVFVQSGNVITAELISATGSKLQTKQISGNGSFNLSELPNGVYVIRVKEGNKSFKIIKQ